MSKFAGWARWAEKNIAVDSHMDNIAIYADEGLLQQVWVNLLDNAIQFTGEGGHILLTIKKDGGNAGFEIEDDGRGMDEQALVHLFDKFYQAGASRSRSGNGLGLSMLQWAVALSEEKVEVESSPGKSSRLQTDYQMEPLMADALLIEAEPREKG